ncbi:MAG: SseB family protein [Lachnospiraceae bacterium]|nr:SseB family protein [Lachnospiraceae bacterium]
MTQETMIENLKNADSVWTVIDRITSSPFIDDGNRVWIFTKKEYADRCLDYFMQQYRTSFEIREIDKDRRIRFFGITTHMAGAEEYSVDPGTEANMIIKGSDIVPPVDMSDTPMINRPVMNPRLFRAVAKLQQERLYRANYEGKKDKLRAFEDDMIKNFAEAMFLVPVKGMEALKKNFESTNGSGEGVLTAGTQISIPSLSGGDDNAKATPVFTDWIEFNKAYSQEEWGGWIWTPKDLLSAPDDPVVLNVGSLAFAMSKKMIGQMLDIYEKEFADKK